MATAKNIKKRRARTETRLVVTNYGAHLCEFTPDPQGNGYTVVAKHVPGVVTQGRTLREAEQMAREALELCIECLTQAHTAPRTRRRVMHRTPLATRA